MPARKPARFFARESLTIGASEASLSASIYEPSDAASRLQGVASFALLSVEDDQLRFWFDGDGATARTLVSPGQTIELDGLTDIRNFRAIRVTGDATLRVHYARGRW